MLNINIFDREEVVYGSKLSTKQEQFKERWINTLKSVLNQNKTILFNNAPNRIGKTITTLMTLLKTDKNVLYVSDRHKQISEVDDTLENEKFKHWWGLLQLCSQQGKNNRRFLIQNDTPSKYICSDCIVKKDCNYRTQFNLKGISMVGAPKEFLMLNYIHKFEPDIIIFDEIIDKGRTIKPTIPELTAQIFEEFGLESYYDVYGYIKYLIETKNFDYEKENIETLKEEAEYIISEELSTLVNKIKKRDITVDYHIISDLLKFLFNLRTTAEFIEYCTKYGYSESFEIPFLYDAFKLMEEYNCNLIILNTSLDREILDMTIEGYEGTLPEPIEFTYPIINHNSVLLHYNNNNRSLSKSALFETDEKGRVQTDEHGKAKINTSTYSPEIFDMVFSILAHCKKLGMKTGVITFKSAIALFKDKADVIGYFGGHQGSNEFDNIDLLLILGTFNLNPGAVYLKYQCITQTFTADKNDTWNNYHHINGMRIRYSDNEQLNKVKTYKLNEEHGQAIYRSGAHVHDDKIVICFGFVPQGVENTLTYSTFKSKRGLKISTTKHFNKIQKQQPKQDYHYMEK